jgi:hypothetical protein
LLGLSAAVTRLARSVPPTTMLTSARLPPPSAMLEIALVEARRYMRGADDADGLERTLL